MGKVFTYDEIRHGRVPKPAAFDAAHALAREVFIRHAEICTAVLFGSYLRGEQTGRSNLNYVLLYDAKHEQEVMSTVGRLHREAYLSKGVPIHMVPICIVDGRADTTQLSHTLVCHVRHAVGKCGLLKGNLTAIVPTAGGEKQYDSVSAHLALRAVLAGWCALSVLDEVERATYFAHALEATHHLVQAAYVHEYETVAPNRESLRAWYKDLYPGYLADAYARICATDDAYTEAVSRAVRMPKGWYVGCVRDVRDAIPAIVEFMRNHLAYEDAMATPPEA